MTAAPTDQLADTLRRTGRLVEAVPPDSWSHPTPCADWTVRDLLNHLVEGQIHFTGIVGGGSGTSQEQSVPRHGLDRLGDDPVGAYHRSADDLVAAFRQPGALERTYSLPIGPAPGALALQLRITEALVHGWDLAQSTGQRTAFDEDVVEQALSFSRRALSEVLPGRSPFAPPRPVPDDAPAIDRLAALLGRQVPSRDVGDRG